MVEIVERKRIAAKVVDNDPRCSDFDWECSHVMDHAACHRGGAYTCPGGSEVEMPPADGYCPYLRINA